MKRRRFSRGRGLIFGLALMPGVALGAEYGATYTAPPVVTVCLHREAIVPVTVTNTGTRVWGAGAGHGGKPLRARIGDIPYLTYHLVNLDLHQTILEVDTTYISDIVGPGQTVTVNMHVAAPVQQNARYEIQWDMGNLYTLFSEQGVPTGKATLQFGSNIACLASLVVKIENIILDGPDEVSPDMSYVVTGVRFGTTPGSASLTSPGFKGGPFALQIMSWDDSSVAFKVPARCGEVDQGAEIRVTDSRGATSTWPVKFVATREVRHLMQSDMQVNCAQLAGRHRCNDVGHGPIGATDLTAFPDFALTGQHQSLGFNAIGTDDFWTTLINGWRISGVQPHIEGNDLDSLGDYCTSFTGDYTDCTLYMTHTDDHVTVQWKTGVALSAMGYLGKVFVTGPCGTPYR